MCNVQWDKSEILCVDGTVPYDVAIFSHIALSRNIAIVVLLFTPIIAFFASFFPTERRKAPTPAGEDTPYARRRPIKYGVSLSEDAAKDTRFVCLFNQML